MERLFLFEKLQISKPEISIVIEYLVTLRFLLEPTQKSSLSDYITPETEQILNELISVDKGSLVLLRMNNSVVAGRFVEWMKSILECFDNDNLFDVVLDSDGESDLWDSLSAHSKKKYCDFRMQDSLQRPESMTYKDLVHLPILLVVIEKCRMGDTLPENFKYFDLRCRYTEENGKQTIYSSLLQDIGRAFGYGQRPTVFITKFIKEKLESNQFELRPHQTLELEKNEDDLNNPEAADEEDGGDPLKPWKMGKNHPLYNRDINVGDISRRFLLSAHPQNGKTGAFLSAIKIFIRKYSNDTETHDPPMDLQDNYISGQNSFKTMLYKLKSIKSSKLHSSLSNLDSQERKDWDKFHLDLFKKKKTLEASGKALHTKICIKKIKELCRELLRKSNQNCIKVVDMGCGTAEIAQHFHDIGYIYESKKKQVKLEIVSVDHAKIPLVPDYIHITESDMGHVVEKIKQQENSFDFVVF